MSKDEIKVKAGLHLAVCAIWSLILTIMVSWLAFNVYGAWPAFVFGLVTLMLCVMIVRSTVYFVVWGAATGETLLKLGPGDVGGE